MFRTTVKINGRKQKIEILEKNDIIKNHHWIWTGYNGIDYNKHIKEHYQWYISNRKHNPSACSGDLVSKHNERMYFKIISF